MKFFRVALTCSAASIALLAAAGPSPVGTWKGHIQMDASKMTITDPNQIIRARQQMAAAQKLQLTVTLKADKTFTGSPPPTTGNWSLKGNQLTLVAKGQSAAQVFTLSKDGKTLTKSLPSSHGVTSKIVLKKS